jgi:hypothetical protein
MTPLSDAVARLMAADPQGRWLATLYSQLPDVHWGALRRPGRPVDAPLARTVGLVDGDFTLACVVETDTVFLAIEDARGGALATGTATDPKRHHVSRCIEALRELARARATARGEDTDPLFGVVVVGGSASDDPHRTTILEGLPHIEREQAEDLYASYWGRVSPEAFDALAGVAAR